jgi:hypothetical protein
MARYRESSQEVTFPILLGQNYMDYSPPYGNGPWTPTSAISLAVANKGPGIIFHKTCMDELHSGPPWKTGGPLNITEWKSDFYVPKAAVDVSYSMWRYAGSHLASHYPPVPWGSLSEYTSSDADNIESYGPTGWNRFRPDRSQAQLGIFLGEFKDVPRMLKGTAKGFHDLWRSMGGSKTAFKPKNVANNWLNTQFGWMPFVADLRDFYEVTKNLDNRISQLRRQNNQWQKRSGTVSVEGFEEEMGSGDNTPGLTPVPSTWLFQAPYGWWKTKYVYSRHVWFSARFRYYIPGDTSGWRWRAKAIAQLYGLNPTPSLIWELTPWSWLLDWWTNVGDNIANLSAITFDNLAAKHAYIMGTTSHKFVSEGCNNYKGTPAIGSWSSEIIRKSRFAASPFGFGLDGGDFTARQWSILAALGITRIKY